MFHHDVSIRRFSEIIAHLPDTISSLNLDNNLWSVKTLSAVLGSLRPSIKYLRLREDKLHSLTNDKLTHVFSQLKTITHLDLSRDFSANYSIPVTSLAEAIKVLPETIIKLNLRYNNLNSMNFATFLTLITNLPKQLRSLNLGANKLGF